MNIGGLQIREFLKKKKGDENKMRFGLVKPEGILG